jgi:putative transposase
MARKRYKPEEIGLPRPGHGRRDPPDWCKRSDLYRWRQEFGGLKIEEVKRLKDLELENSRLRKAVSDLTLDKLILQEAARGNF